MSQSTQTQPATEPTTTTAQFLCYVQVGFAFIGALGAAVTLVATFLAVFILPFDPLTVWAAGMTMLISGVGGCLAYERLAWLVSSEVTWT